MTTTTRPAAGKVRPTTPAKPPKAACVRCGRPLSKRNDQRCSQCLGMPLRPPGWQRREYYVDPDETSA
jgi:ribosomal protein L37E